MDKGLVIQLVESMFNNRSVFKGNMNASVPWVLYWKKVHAFKQ